MSCFPSVMKHLTYNLWSKSIFQLKGFLSLSPSLWKGMAVQSSLIYSSQETNEYLCWQSPFSNLFHLRPLDHTPNNQGGTFSYSYWSVCHPYLEIPTPRRCSCLISLAFPTPVKFKRLVITQNTEVNPGSLYTDCPQKC